MEQRVIAKANQIVDTLKKQIVGYIQEHGDQLSPIHLIQYVTDLETDTLQVEDFRKSTRVQNSVPIHQRCHAKRTNGQQCTRKKQTDSNYCGTHTKSTPYGIMSETELEAQYQAANECSAPRAIQIYAQSIMGLIYYIDHFGNVYKTEDILTNHPHPSICAKYTKSDNNVYSIEQLTK